MQPFESLTEAIRWWRANAIHRPVGLLVDFRDIGKGIQKRETRWDPCSGWIMGFPD